MKKISLIYKAMGLLILTIIINNSYAQQIQPQSSSTFSCSTNAECKKKCEKLGKDHTWKPNPGGSTLGSCTKRGRVFRPLRERLNSPPSRVHSST